MDQLQNMDKALSQMQDELLAKINKMKEVIAIYAKAHSDVETIMTFDNADFLMSGTLKEVSCAQDTPDSLVPVREKRPYNKHKSELNKLKSKLANTAKKKAGPTIAEATRELLDKYFETSEVFTMDGLLTKVGEVCPSANYSNVRNAYDRYLLAQKWEQRVHVNEAAEREILLTKKEEAQ